MTAMMEVVRSLWSPSPGDDTPTGDVVVGTDDMCKGTAATTDSTNDSSTSKGIASSNPRFKTEICNQFTTFGSCPYGTKCQFAHGASELREPPHNVRHPKYKTQLCKNYHEKSGICPYGRRCHFIHDEVPPGPSDGSVSSGGGISSGSSPSGSVSSVSVSGGSSPSGSVSVSGGSSPSGSVSSVSVSCGSSPSGSVSVSGGSSPSGSVSVSGGSSPSGGSNTVSSSGGSQIIIAGNVINVSGSTFTQLAETEEESSGCSDPNPNWLKREGSIYDLWDSLWFRLSLGDAGSAGAVEKGQQVIGAGAGAGDKVQVQQVWGAAPAAAGGDEVLLAVPVQRAHLDHMLT